MAELTTVETRHHLSTADDVIRLLPLGERPTDRAARMALARLIVRANRRRRDERKPPLRGIRIGRETFYADGFVGELLASL